MHELNNIKILDNILSNAIVQYKFIILDFFKEYLKSLYRIHINNNGFVNITTREQLPETMVNDFITEFDVQLFNQDKVKVNDKKLYSYIFKPPELPMGYHNDHCNDYTHIKNIINIERSVLNL